MRTLLLTASFLAMAVPAMAQAPLPQTAAPFGGAQRPMMPERSAQFEGSQGMPSGPITSPAQMPVQPAGGFGATPPAPGASDPAQRMNLSGAPSYVGELRGESTSRLNQMNPAAGPSAGREADLSLAPISNQSDLEELTKRQRSIVTLEQQVKEAKLAVELWGVLYNNEHAKAWREEEKKDKEAKVKAEETKAKDAMAQAATINAGAAMASALRTPVPPQVVEVVGSKALVLVQGSGEVWARVGQTLPGGLKVTRVTAKAVEVKGPTGIQVLGFGSQVSPPPMPPMPAMPAAPVTLAPRL